MTSPTDGVGARGAIGARLRSARERAGLSPIQAAEKLHIDTGVLEALEAEKFEELGAPVYVRGYIRHYADLVGESPAELQALYAASAHAACIPDLTRIPKVESARASGTLLLPGVAVVIAVALIGTAWWILGSLSGGLRPQRGGIVSPLAPAPNGARAGGGPAAGQVHATDAAPRPAPRSSLSTPPANAAAPAQGSGVPHVKISALTMHFSEDSWTEVYDARGDRLFYDVGFAGSTRTVRGTPPLRVVLGNPPEVALALDGRSVSVPDAERNVVTEFRINRSGHMAPMRLAAAARDSSDDKKKAGPVEIN